MNDKVSIICPTRNRWDILRERALKSVCNQTYKNWELILVDDGSTEFTKHPGIQPDYYKYDIKLFIIEKEYTYPKDNKKAEWLSGPCNALNHALSKVNNNSDWIARLDDDDIWKPDALERLLGFAKSGNYDFVSALWEDKNGNIAKPYKFKDLKIDINCYLGGVQTWLYKAKYKDVLYNGESWKKDWNANNELDWFERFFEKHHPWCGFLNEVVCTICPRPGENEIGSKAYVK